MALQNPKREGRKKYYCGMMALTFIKGMDLAILHTTYGAMPRLGLRSTELSIYNNF